MRATLLAAFVFVFAQVLSACAMSDNTVVLHTSKGNFTFDVELAVTPEERAKGLMYRQELASNAGMLFDFGSEQEVAFWMQNTLIPLDMIFVAADGTVRRIQVNARPMDTTPIPSGSPVRFVLEIAGGRSEEIGLKVGDHMDNPRVASTGGQ